MVEPWWYSVAREGLAQGTNSGNLLNFRFVDPVKLRIAVEDWQPYTQVSKDPTTGATILRGPSYNILQALASSLNFTYTLVQGDGYFGAPQPNGSWDGMIGMLLRQEVDLALGPFAMTPSRSQVIDFTEPLFLEKMRILQARPSPRPDPWGLLAPFSGGVWVGVVSSLLAIFVMSLTVSTWLRERVSGSGEGPPRHTDHFLQLFSILVTQALLWSPRVMAMRVTLGVWMLVTIIIVNGYGGSLTSLLTVQRVHVKYDSLRQVLQDPSINIIIQGSTALRDQFKISRSGAYRELMKAVEVRGLVLNAQEYWDAQHLVLDGDHVMLTEDGTSLKLMSDHVSLTGRCDHYVSRDHFFPMIIATAVQKSSPLLPLLNHRIRMVREYGLYDAWIRQELYNSSVCLASVSLGSSLMPYTITHLWGAFLILGVGLGLASTALCWEVFYSRTASLTSPKPSG